MVNWETILAVSCSGQECSSRVQWWFTFAGDCSYLPGGVSQTGRGSQKVICRNRRLICKWCRWSKNQSLCYYTFWCYEGFGGCALAVCSAFTMGVERGQPSLINLTGLHGLYKQRHLPMTYGCFDQSLCAGVFNVSTTFSKHQGM